MNDDAIYEQVAAEIAAGRLKPGLWAKVFAEADGDRDVARARYIRLRAAQLIAEVRSNEKAESDTIPDTGRSERSTLRRRAAGGMLLGFASLLAVISCSLLVQGRGAKEPLLLAAILGAVGYRMVRS